MKYPPGAGRAQAIAEWASHCCRRRVIGSIDGTRPQLENGASFYTVSLGSEESDARLQYCADYNDTLDELIAEHGIPSWAPGARLISREETLQALEVSVDTATLSRSVRDAIKDQQFVRRERGIETARIAIDDARRLIFNEHPDASA